MKPWIGGWDSRFSILSFSLFSLQHVQPRIPGFFTCRWFTHIHILNWMLQGGFNLFENSENLTQMKNESIENVFETLPRILHWISIDVLLDHFQENLPFNRPFSKGWTAMKQQVLSFPTSYCSWKVKSIFFLLSGTNRCWSPTLSTKLQYATSASSSSSSSSSSTSPSYQWTQISQLSVIRRNLSPSYHTYP